MLLTPYISLAVAAGPVVYEPLRPTSVRRAPSPAISSPVAVHGARPIEAYHTSFTDLSSPKPKPLLRIFSDRVSKVNSAIGRPSPLAQKAEVTGVAHSIASQASRAQHRSSLNIILWLLSKSPITESGAGVLTNLPESQWPLGIATCDSKKPLKYNTTTLTDSVNITEVFPLPTTMSPKPLLPSVQNPVLPMPKPAIVHTPLTCPVGLYNGIGHLVPPQETCSGRIAPQTQPRNHPRTLARDLDGNYNRTIYSISSLPQRVTGVVHSLPTCAVGSFNGTEHSEHTCPAPIDARLQIRGMNPGAIVNAILLRVPVMLPRSPTNFDICIMKVFRDGSSLLKPTDTSRSSFLLGDIGKDTFYTASRTRTAHSVQFHILAFVYTLCFVATLYFCTLAASSADDDGAPIKINLVPSFRAPSTKAASTTWILSILNYFRARRCSSKVAPNNRKSRAKAKYRRKHAASSTRNGSSSSSLTDAVQDGTEPAAAASTESTNVVAICESVSAADSKVFDVVPPCLYIAGRRYNRRRLKKL